MPTLRTACSHRLRRALSCYAQRHQTGPEPSLALEAYRPGAVTNDDVQGLVLAGWSASHGFATLALTANLSEHLDGDTAALASQVVRGFITMGELARRAES